LDPKRGLPRAPVAGAASLRTIPLSLRRSAIYPSRVLFSMRSRALYPSSIPRFRKVTTNRICHARAGDCPGRGPHYRLRRNDVQRHNKSVARTPPLHVIVADDHALIRELLERQLRELDADVRVHHAGTLQQVLETMRTVEQLDLVLLDLGMPGMNGF